MKEIRYVHEPTDLQCGQAVLAMVLGKTAEEICELLSNDRETTLREMKSLLRSHGAWVSDERVQAVKKEELPPLCMLSLETPRCWHWSLYADGTFYDPEHGVMDDFPESGRRYFWEIRTEAGEPVEKSFRDVLQKLEAAGYEAYLVGGCVRDSIIGREVHDTDITTSALPEEVEKVFGRENIIPTGIKHGTVTVYKKFEVTTYRIDGEYRDSRRPESVTFTRSLRDDLARRDFTINAIAMDSSGMKEDPFGGCADIERRIIRCVGEPEKRFSEDALRILRAVRFASQLGFEIEESTSAAIHRMKDSLMNISHERVRDELDKLICGANCVKVLLGYSDVITAVIPEFGPCIGFDQRSPYHRYTVWEHIVRAMASAPEDDLTLRRALFFHDISKPACATFDSTGRGHFKGHDKAGAELTGEIMRRLRWDSRSVETTVTLIANHSQKLKTKADVKRMMSVVGDEQFFRLMEMKKCDNLGKNEFVAEENVFFDSLIAEGRRIAAADECRSVRGLAVSGRDIMSAGLSGEEVGRALDELLELVITEKLPNEKGALMEHIRRGIYA